MIMVEMVERKELFDPAILKDIDSAEDLLTRCFGPVSKIDLPIDVDYVISCIKGVRLSRKVRFEDLLKSGFVRVERDEQKSARSILIWVNPTEVPQRQRFTAAHELGHLVHDVYPNIDDENVDEEIYDTIQTFNRGPVRSYRETRANNFAAQLLMPSKVISREVKNLIAAMKADGQKISKGQATAILARKFDVSKDAMRIRLETLGYL